VSDPRLAELRRRLTARTDAPIAFVRAPGRVNLIGDHTDYQDGLCLPMAIDRDVVVAYAARTDGRHRVESLDLATESGEAPAPWVRTLDAIDALLGHATGYDAVVASTIPIRSGLSSSAAFEVAMTLVAADVAGIAIEGSDLARLAQEVEHRATGVPCGVMDQMASVCGRANHALLLDCRDLSVEPVPLPDAAAVVVVHSGLPRALEDTEYAARGAACKAAAARLGVATLRDATAAQVADDPFARHVVSENARVAAFVAALRAGDLAACGVEMLASHASLRNDFAVSTPELDRLVDLATAHGAWGARLTGAGFGGCIVALVPIDIVEPFAARVTADYVAGTGLPARAFTVRAAGGAGPIS
jgi:galactokinase